MKKLIIAACGVIVIAVAVFVAGKYTDDSVITEDDTTTEGVINLPTTESE